MAVTSLAAQAANRAELAKAVANMQVVLGAAHVGAGMAAESIGIAMVNEIKRTLSRPGSGKVYTRRSVTHQASAPGEPPAPDTGIYRGSWTHVAGRTLGGAFVDVGTPMPLGWWLEVGTRKIAARPHVRVALGIVTPRVPAIVSTAVGTSQRAAAARLRGAATALGGPLGIRV